MTTWKQDLRSSFGLEDRKFGYHPSDRESAYDMLGKVIKQNVSMPEIEAEVRDFLKDNPKLHADEQVQRVKQFIEIWIE